MGEAKILLFAYLKLNCNFYNNLFKLCEESNLFIVFLLGFHDAIG